MEAVGEIIMEAGYPTVLCFQVIQGYLNSSSSSGCRFPVSLLARMVTYRLLASHRAAPGGIGLQARLQMHDLNAVSARLCAGARLPHFIHGSQPAHASAGSSGERVLMLAQEVTRESFQMMQKSPWWGRYMSSPTLEQQSYDTALLYNKSQVSVAGPFEKHYFRNSRMGATNTWTILPPLMGVGSLGCSV